VSELTVFLHVILSCRGEHLGRNGSRRDAVLVGQDGDVLLHGVGAI